MIGLQMAGQFVRRVTPGELADGRIDDVGLGAPEGVAEVFRRVELLGVIGPDLQEFLPVLPADVEVHVAVAAGKDPGGRHVLVLAAGAVVDLLLVGVEPDHVLLGGQRLLHGHVDPVAGARAFTPMQRRDDAQRGHEAAEVIGLGLGRRARGAVRIAGDGHQPAHGEHHEVVVREPAVGTPLAEPRDGGHDEGRVDLPEPRVVQLQPGQPSRRVAFDQDVGAGNQRSQPVAVFRKLEIQFQGALVGVEMGEHQTGVAGKGRQAPHRVTARRLDLEDLHAEVRQEAAAHLALAVGEVQGPVSLQQPRGAGWGFCLLF